MAKAKTLRCFMYHLPLKSSGIVDGYLLTHLLENLRKVVSDLDLLHLVVFFPILALDLLIVFLFLVFPFFLLLLLLWLLLFLGLFLFIEELDFVTGSNPESHLLLSSEILCTRDMTMGFNPFDKCLDVFVDSHTLYVSNQDEHAPSSGNCHIHPPPIP